MCVKLHTQPLQDMTQNQAVEISQQVNQKVAGLLLSRDPSYLSLISPHLKKKNMLAQPFRQDLQLPGIC